MVLISLVAICLVGDNNIENARLFHLAEQQLNESFVGHKKLFFSGFDFYTVLR